MRPTPITQQRAWWSDQLQDITRRSLAYLRRHFPRIAESHEDIASEAKTHLVELISRQPDFYPASWFASVEPSSPKERDYLFQLAQTILRRRIADHFREPVFRWARESNGDPESLEHLQATPVQHERRLLLRRMLKVCIETIGTLPEEDRLLVSRLAGESDRNGVALSAAERQRIHRLRRRLADEIRKQLGDSVSEMLRDE